MPNIMSDVGNLPVDRPAVNALSMEEVVAFLENVSPHYRNCFVTAFFTGMRLGEQVGLKWKSIDCRNKKSLIRESRVAGIEGRPIEGETLRNAIWTPALKRAGLEYRSMYHTRHSFATLVLSSGESVGWAQSMTGRASLRMIKEHYFRFIPNLTHQDGSAFSTKFEGVLAKTTPNRPIRGVRFFETL